MRPMPSSAPAPPLSPTTPLIELSTVSAVEPGAISRTMSSIELTVRGYSPKRPISATITISSGNSDRTE